MWEKKGQGRTWGRYKYEVILLWAQNVPWRHSSGHVERMVYCNTLFLHRPLWLLAIHLRAVRKTSIWQMLG